jgi:hypothetical protein
MSLSSMVLILVPMTTRIEYEHDVILLLFYLFNLPLNHALVDYVITVNFGYTGPLDDS